MRTPGILLSSFGNTFLRYSTTKGFRIRRLYFVTQTTWYCSCQTPCAPFLTSMDPSYRRRAHSSTGEPVVFCRFAVAFIKRHSRVSGRRLNECLTVWRRGWDSNPRSPQGDNAFRVRPVRPLRHLSADGLRILLPSGIPMHEVLVHSLQQTSLRHCFCSPGF